MFLGHTLLKVAALTNFLKDALPPGEEDLPGIFDKPIEHCYDYIVVGSGSAGGIIATRLSEDPVSVLLLEAGGSELENEFTQISKTKGKFKGTHQDWQYQTVPQGTSHLARKEQRVLFSQGKLLGGTGSVNGMNFLRGSRHDYDEWEKEGCSGWSYNDVLPYFKKMENVEIPEYRDSPYRGTNGPTTVVNPQTTMLSFFHQQAAAELGYDITDCNGYNQTGFCRCQANMKNGKRCSTASCYLREVLHRNNLQISLNSQVTKIIIDGKVARGVKFLKNGEQMQVFAREEVIISAGAMGSPQILLLSGIGPRDHLHEMRIPFRVDLPVGQNLQNHISLNLPFSTNVTLNVNKKKIAETETKLKYILERKDWFAQVNDGYIYTKVHQDNPSREYPDVQLQFLQLSLEGINNQYIDEIRNELLNRTTESGFGLLIYYLHPRDRGEIKLSSRDPHDLPLIDPKCLSHEYDIMVITKIIRFIQRLQQTKSWTSIDAQMIRLDTTGHCDDVTYDSDEYWRCIILHYARSGGHQCGTCRMGSAADPTAVVDPRLRVKGIENLRVADASVMRNVVSANTYAAAMMIGEKAADMIKEDRLSTTFNL